jgi:3-oxoacyl-[acyl-carrier-protein] synthase III
MRYQHVSLQAIGYELPPVVLSSDAIEERLAPVYERLKLPAGRLELMSGIRERRLWDKRTRPSDAAILAGRKTIAKAGIGTDEIECLIFTAVSRDMLEPATASFVHAGLDLHQDCLVFDISNACLGFLDGMIMLANMIELGQVTCGLIVAGETAEELLESTISALLANERLTRKSIKSSFASLTIGSGAIGLIMHRDNGNDNEPRLVGASCLANTSHNRLCQGGQIMGANTGMNATLMATDSEELLKRGIETAALTWRKFLTALDWEPRAIDVFFCHQVGRAHARLLFDTLNIDPAKNFETLEYLGNVGSVSAPVTMAIGIEEKVFHRGQRAALLGIGSGINCLMLGIEWP